ncbi:MAG TPA: PhoU domain-containing protein [Methanothrix soehngenii]|jgi:phosphate uptake regulator|uniref:Abc transport system regulatory protein n=2 Tax=root TaxID=1 RepID=A0A0W8FC55_9ZZZZ|nr:MULTISPECIES: phosphate uptake regulator PhoU [Methanothrix]MDD3551483.1 PhoU domain-containing protein [Methanothrix soehngenii]MDY0412520.1 PhoU domain-containing protein [Methanothrix soehngenii]HNQ52680.1 PhoU domain-containing protein [Methanothrix soehngenii]HNT45495.1 PhoU domain-containing protein [Methanothrix soehngenii]HOE44532.1 PhoU domain-containing protein [Methanothrix soehngenii]
MDTRKVQRTGKSTFIVSLPKTWATKNGIAAGSIVYINQGDNGALTLSTDRSERDLRVKLDIGEKTGDDLIRDIIGCYVGGYRIIEVTSPHMSSAQKKDLHQIVNKLIGPEILEETINKVVIQDLLSSEELQSEKALRRIRTVVKSMIHDSFTSLLNNNQDELAMDVIQRDDDVDRLNLLISRQFTEILRTGSVKQETQNPIHAFNYMQAASNLERIADHAHRIAQIAREYNCTLADDLKEELMDMEVQLCGFIDDAISYLLQTNSDKANEMIDLIREIQKSAARITVTSDSLGKSEMLERLVLAASLERMFDYIMNIGELTINLSHSTKQAEKG